MTTYTLHTLYLVACSILPERKHRRCFAGSRKERIGNAIRSRRKAMRSGSCTGSLCPVSSDLADRRSLYNALSGFVKSSAINGDQSLYENPQNGKTPQKHHKITVRLPLIADHTLKPIKNGVKRIGIRETDRQTREFHGEIPAKHITTRVQARIFPTGGVCFNNFLKSPFHSPYHKAQFNGV